MSLEDSLKDAVLEIGADFVGIAPRSRFAAAPPFSDPARLLPKYRSVVAFGIAMDQGTLEAWFSKSNRRPMVLQNRLATDEIDRISFKTSRWLERQGYKSTFVAENGYYNGFRGRPDFSHRHAAVAAGLGRLGLSSLLVHPKYGAAVYPSSVITEAPLEADPMLEEDPCHHCNLCIEICPTKAIDREREVSFHIEGQEYTHRWVDKVACGWGCAGLSGHRYQIGKKTVGTWAYNDLEMPQDRREFTPRFLEADRKLRHPAELAEIEITSGTQFCGNCTKVCVGSKKENAAMFKLHVDSGIVDIPRDPALMYYLRQANARLQPYAIPVEEVEALAVS